MNDNNKTFYPAVEWQYSDRNDDSIHTVPSAKNADISLPDNAGISTLINNPKYQKLRKDCLELWLDELEEE